MVLWTQSISTIIFREDCSTKMKANTVAAAAVLWSPDKTMQQVLKKRHALCSLSFFVSLFSLSSVFI